MLIIYIFRLHQSSDNQEDFLWALLQKRPMFLIIYTSSDCTIKWQSRGYTLKWHYRCLLRNLRIYAPQLEEDVSLAYIAVWVTNWLSRMSIGWRRIIRCLKLQVIFRKRATNYRALLRKTIYEDKTPYASSPPCTSQRGAQPNFENLSSFSKVSCNSHLII